ncbi:MAG: excinuclease ABC subunit UvrC [Ruminococcaceae bacterium]|nr:excinuclease ABC subunit UvrC [Oscillospiraceae bacterium]
MNEQCRQKLLQRALSLPLSPGVYLMRDAHGRIIYVGKSRKLKNRVSQYFQNGEKSYKTARMVSQVDDFEYFLCDTEIEALALENTLIKQHSPKYNIRLKDAKSYPFIKITDELYPRLVFTRARLSDRGRYFGPYSGASVAGTVLRTLNKALGLPSCKRRFPRDIGKERPCLYYQLGQCCGVCTGHVTPEAYAARVRYAADILRGNSAAARRQVREEMGAAAQREEFEKAAALRDTLFALESLSEKQKVVAAPDTAEDVFGFYRDDFTAVMAVFYVREGALIDKTEVVFSQDELLDENEAIVSFLYDHYRARTDVPPRVLLSFSLPEEDKEMLSAFLSERSARRTVLHTPERGELKTLCELAVSNARERAAAVRREREQSDETTVRLAALLALEVVPERIEAYDISNLGAEHKTCGMIVFENGRLVPSEYRTFRIRDVEGTDDYASMREALSRRFAHLGDENGSFSKLPDLILLDGGRTHVAAVREVARSCGVTVPIFGMVKDEYHKTRALCTDSEEISIALDKAVFGLIYRIQEEVHRYAVRRMSEAKRKSVKTSELEKIAGVGKAKAKVILAHFGGLGAVRRADEAALAAAPGVGPVLARVIYTYFHGKES